MNADDHFPYDGLINVEDKISVLVKRLNLYIKDDFLGDVISHHIALEISEQRDLYNFLVYEDANKTLEYFGISVVNGKLKFKDIFVTLIPPKEEDTESIFKSGSI